MRRQALLRGEWVIALAFLVLIPAAVGIYFVDEQRRDSDRRARVAQQRDSWARYDSSVSACIRGNAVRAHDAQQDSAIKALARLVAIFLDSSVDLRGQLGQDQAALEAADLRDAIKAVAGTLKDAPQVNCDAAIVPPPFPRPSP